MSENIRIVVLGTGQMGAGIIKLLLQKPGLELAGVYGRRPSRDGLDVGPAIGLEKSIGVTITNDLHGVLSSTRPQVVIQATYSRVVEAVDEITAALHQGANVISIAEEMAYPTYQSPHLAAAIHRLAVANQVTVVGTGINPGFVLDTLVIALTSVCCSVTSITAQRINDLSPYGPTVLRNQGVGLTSAAFIQGVQNGSIVGHFGFPESISMIAHALGWSLDRIEQHREPIISHVKRRTPLVTIEPGWTAGCRHTAVAYMGGKPVITLIQPQQVYPHLEHVVTGDYIDVDGEPAVHFASSPEIPGGLGTVALAVNMIPQVLCAAPGLKSMIDLPVPAAIMGDVRTLITQKR
jgi:4-hydroxy-tetrahydrodipicolinate reductase